MKSISWAASSRHLSYVSAALLVALAGCAKDTESRAPRSAQAGDDPAPGSAATTGDPIPGFTPGAARGAPPDVLGLGNPDGTRDISYSIEIEAPPDLSAGAEGVARVVVRPGEGWKMSDEFPTRLQVVSPEGVTLAKDRQTIDDAERFEDSGATFAVQFKADSTGSKSFKADFRFAVCTETTCDPKRTELAWDVDVQ